MRSNPLFVLIFLVSPSLALAKEGKLKKLSTTPLVVALYIGLLLLTAGVAMWLRHYRERRLLVGHHNRRQMTVSQGLDSEEIDSLPSLRFSEIKMHQLGKVDQQLECAVCLSKVNDQELLRVLPDCFHAFHPNCIAPWLASHLTCPICRTSLEHRRGSSMSLSSIEDGTSGPLFERYEQSDDQHDDDDDQGIIEIEAGSSTLHSEVNLESSSHPPSNNSIGKLPRSYSTGDMMAHMVGQHGTSSNNFLSSLLPKESCPTSDYRITTISPKSDRFVDYSSLNV